MASRIYKYDLKNNKFALEAITTPYVKFYDNGYMFDYSSHNHSFGEYWPYILSKYNPDTWSYDFVANVSSWDSSFATENYNGDQFPYDIDKDNNGTVYIINDSDYTSYEYLDDDEFAAWEAQYSSANEIPVNDVYPLAFYEYSTYTTDYKSMCLKDALKGAPNDLILDIGRVFLNADNLEKYYYYYDYNDDTKYSYQTKEAVMTELSEKFGLTSSEQYYSDDFIEDTVFLDASGNTVASFSELGNYSFSLKDKTIDGLYIFGIQPNMTLDEAQKAINNYHLVTPDFDSYYSDYDKLTYYYYRLGSDASFINISLGVNRNDVIKNVSISEGCSFAG